VGALATSWDDDELQSSATAAKLHRLTSCPGSAATEKPEESPRWNVLAEELVSYPPLAQRIWLEKRPAESSARARSYATAWLDAELESLAERRRLALGASRRVAPPLSGVSGPSTDRERTRSVLVYEQPHPRATKSASPARRTRPKTRVHLASPRGLRRLLPGVATLAVLGSLWFGIGALATAAHSSEVVRLPGAVPVAGGYAYTVEPGDTLWTIASRARPGADPRPLVDQLQAELHGRPLLPGERLILPR
jgi:hypothetical protein